MQPLHSKSKNLYLISMHKSYDFNANKPVNIIIYTWKTKGFERKQCHIASIQRPGHEHTTVKWPIVHCFPFICLHRGVAWDFESERMEEKLEAFQIRGVWGYTAPENVQI